MSIQIPKPDAKFLKALRDAGYDLPPLDSPAPTSTRKPQAARPMHAKPRRRPSPTKSHYVYIKPPEKDLPFAEYSWIIPAAWIATAAIGFVMKYM